MLRCVAAFACLLAVPAQAVTFTSSPGAPDPGIAKGETLLVSFDAPDPKGITTLTKGFVLTGAGSNSNRAAPAGTAKGGGYQSLSAGGSSLFDFADWSKGRGLSSFSVYWGSVDTYNHVDFLNFDGKRVGGISGADLPVANGNQGLGATNRRVFFNFLPGEKVAAVKFRSTGTAFEFDSLAATAAVPEPATWAMLITGFGLIGHAMRRRGQARPAIAASQSNVTA